MAGNGLHLEGSFTKVKSIVKRRRRRRAYAPTSNTTSHDNHEKINSWVSFCFPYMGCLRGCAWLPFGPPELRYAFGENVSPHIFHKKNCCDLDLGESLCISTFFLFPDSRLNRSNCFYFLFWSILTGVTLKTSNYFLESVYIFTKLSSWAGILLIKYLLKTFSL